MRLSREKIVRISHQVTDLLVQSNEVEFIESAAVAVCDGPPVFGVEMIASLPPDCVCRNELDNMSVAMIH